MKKIHLYSNVLREESERELFAQIVKYDVLEQLVYSPYNEGKLWRSIPTSFSSKKLKSLRVAYTGEKLETTGVLRSMLSDLENLADLYLEINLDLLCL